MSRGKGKPKKDYTDEDLIEIRNQNKRRLEEIFSNPNWRYELGKKHFGEKRWQKVFFGENHPDYKDWKFDPNREKVADTNRPISEWDENGNLIDTYENITEVIEKYGWDMKKSTHIIDTCRGKNIKSYGRVWKFEDLD